MDKVFAVAGVSTLEGVVKARFAKDLARVKVLEKNGHTAIRLVELPSEMTKDAALAWLRGHKDFQDAAAQAAFAKDDDVKKPAAVKAVPAPAKKAVVAPEAPKVKVEVKVREPVAKVAVAATKKTTKVSPENKDRDTFLAERRELMRQTFARIKEREAEEIEAAAELRREERELGVDNYLNGIA